MRRSHAPSPPVKFERLEVAVELASLVNTTFDVEAVFRAAVPKLQRVLDFRRASVALVSDDGLRYYLRTLYDAAASGFEEVERSFPVHLGLPGRAIRNGSPFRVDAFPGTDGIRLTADGVASAIIVPLDLGSGIIGTLNLGADRSSAYDDEDLGLAVLLARQIELALHYSHLLSTIEGQREALARQHAAVAAERTQLKALIEASDAAVLLISDGVASYANQAMSDILGHPLADIVGAPVDRVHQILSSSLAKPSDLESQISAMQPGGSRLRDRVEFVRPGRMICNRTISPVCCHDVGFSGHLVLYRDVTREADLEIAKDEFVSIVSHELRTPLTSVKTSLHLLRKTAGDQPGSGGQGLLDIALRNLDRLVRLVDDLLDLSRIRSGTLVAKVAPIRISEVAHCAADAVSGLAEDGQVRIDVGSHHDGAEVLADADRLEQVLVNLMSNALRVSPPMGCVGISWWTESASAVIEVSDQGPGIPPSQAERIFDKFTQLGSPTTRQFGGAGLGLAISRSIIEYFGGDLWAESEDGNGASFFVRLPLARPALD